MRITIKLGGSILEESHTRSRLLTQIAQMSRDGHEIILVHGGGKSLNRRLEQMRMTSHFLEGLRVTDADTLGVAVMVLAGEVNKRIVAEMSLLGIKALGICGADAASVRCVPLSDIPGNPKGIGFVGKPTEVQRSFFELVLRAGIVPVVSSIALGEEGQLYNINADQMASACAAGTQCDALIYLTDVAGVRDEDGRILPTLNKSEIFNLRAKGVISGGMLPKTSSCVEAVEAGVSSVYILPGASPDILIRFAEGREGTKIHGNC